MLEELEKHLIINSNRLRTFEDARLKIVTYVETKFGLRIRDSKPSETASRGYCDPTDVDAINSSASGEGKGSPSPRDGCFKCGGAHLQRDCNVDATPRKGNDKKGSRASHGPRGLANERVRKVRETDNPKENPKVLKLPIVRTRVKLRRLVFLVTKTRIQRDVRNLRMMMAGVVKNGMMTGARLDGIKVGNKPMTIPHARFHWEVLILNSSLRFVWLRPVVNAFLLVEFGSFKVTMKMVCADL